MKTNLFPNICLFFHVYKQKRKAIFNVFPIQCDEEKKNESKCMYVCINNNDK